MRGWSFPVGRFLGVDVRVHTFFILLFALAVSAATVAGSTGSRGLALCLLLLSAVAVREIARALTAAWLGLELHSILLLPTGGLQTYATHDANEAAATPVMQQRMALTGPVANLLCGVLLAGVTVAIAPGINLLARPWITPANLLRSFVWIHLLLGAINLLPALPLDGGRFFRSLFAQSHGAIPGQIAAVRLGKAIAFLLMLGGLFTSSLWLILLGAYILIGAQMEDQVLLFSDNDTVLMRDVMLTEFTTLSASDTLEDALSHSVHSLQDVFPVVRGPNLVGAVSRQGIVEALRAEGNGYVQGVMTRSLETARPDDSLVRTLRRIMSGKGIQIVPVLDGGRIVGIITPQNLAHSVGLLNLRRRMKARETRDQGTL